MSMDASVVITGIGLVTPLGCSREKTWAGVRAGLPISVVRNAEDFPDDLWLYVRNAPFVNPNGSHRIFPIALSAAIEALAQAGLDFENIDPQRVGCSVSVSKPILSGTESVLFHPDSITHFLMEKLKIEGPAQNVVAACATGIHSVLLGSRWLKEGLCDVVIAGSCEASLHPLTISGFKNLGVLSKEPRPFDLRRDGFVMGEGAGILVLERAADARARGAKILAEISGCAIGSDSEHPVRFRKDGSSVSKVMARALAEAKVRPEEVDYINLHGTGTAANDAAETRAVKDVWGSSSSRVAASSTKGSTGHLLGAAGSVEMGISCLAIRDAFVPPTAGLEQRDPECDLDYTPGRGKSSDLKNVLSLSFGFGGPIGAVVLRKR